MPNGWLRPSSNGSRISATPSWSASRNSVIRFGLAPMAAARRIVATIARLKMDFDGAGMNSASATVTSPLGST